jgi:PAS domain S-box-containing protein
LPNGYPIAPRDTLQGYGRAFVAGKNSSYKGRIAGRGTGRLPVVSARRTRSTLLHTEDHRQLVDAVGASPLAMVVSNPRLPDNPIEVVNPAFCSLTGYSEGDIVGRNCRFLAGTETEPWVTSQIRDAIRERRPVLVDILNYRIDGTPFRNGVMITPLFDPQGDLAWFLGSQVDLGEPSADRLSGRQARAAAIVAKLPRRQHEVLELMARGLLNKQIAWELKISEKTVKMHRALLLERLHVSTTAEAIRMAVEAGL